MYNYITGNPMLILPGLVLIGISGLAIIIFNMKVNINLSWLIDWLLLFNIRWVILQLYSWQWQVKIHNVDYQMMFILSTRRERLVEQKHIPFRSPEITSVLKWDSWCSTVAVINLSYCSFSLGKCPTFSIGLCLLLLVSTNIC